MFVMKGDKRGVTAFTRAVGRGSNLQVEELDFLMSSEISFIDGKANTVNKSVGANEMETGKFRPEVDISCWWMCSIFKEKNDNIELQKSEEYK